MSQWCFKNGGRCVVGILCVMIPCKHTAPSGGDSTGVGPSNTLAVTETVWPAPPPSV